MSATNPKSPLGTAGQHTLDALRTAIVSGQLRPGDRIRQDEVAESFGVSIAPLREALAVLEKEGQVTYLPRRGYFVAELHISDLQEIYELRAILEERAVRAALPQFEEDAVERIRLAARDCAVAAKVGDVTAELQANRRFHLGLLESIDHPHTLRLIRQLWDSTEAYRALYYNSPDERRITLDAHTRILAALDRDDVDALVAELHSHRQRALDVLTDILGTESDTAHTERSTPRPLGTPRAVSIWTMTTSGVIDVPGLWMPIVTPFDARGDVDSDSLERLAKRILADGATGLAALETAGEPATRRSDRAALAD